MTRRINRAVIVTAVIFVCLALIGSFAFVAFGAEHDCTHDDDCEVCRILDLCIHTIRGGAGFFAVLVVMMLCVMVGAGLTAAVSSTCRAETLISMKTELRN